MAKKSFELLRNLHKLASIISLLADAIIEAGGDADEGFSSLDGDSDEAKAKRKQIAEVIVGKKADGSAYSLVVNYDLPLATAVQRGRYDYANPDITSTNFPGDQKGETTVEGVLVHIGRDVTTAEALAELDKLGLRAATLPELLAFGAQYPEVQRQFPIVALGSVWRDPVGYVRVAYLDRDDRERFLRLGWIGDLWYDIYRFLAVRK